WNVIAISTPDCQIQERYAYDAYGSLAVHNASFTPIPATAFAWPYTYTGRRLDEETGLMYYRNRMYHAELGRFVSRDPVGYAGSHPNLFAYVLNMPPNRNDPSGLVGCGGPPPESQPGFGGLYKGDLSGLIWIAWNMPQNATQEHKKCLLAAKSALDNFQKEAQAMEAARCAEVVISCICCTSAFPDETSNAIYLHGDFPGILACENRLADGDYAAAIRHELVHAYDHCLLKDRTLRFILCTEVRAYHYSGVCNKGGSQRAPNESYEECLEHALFNSLLHHLENPDFIKEYGNMPPQERKRIIRTCSARYNPMIRPIPPITDVMS
ncbi:MAG: RHS repeat-associated core domain-containing protein, partial [Patescibacteria group bacterium]|nr:RHS repeat-associated core domain-containing protein [Patescibacteria group bacterium]